MLGFRTKSSTDLDTATEHVRYNSTSHIDETIHFATEHPAQRSRIKELETAYGLTFTQKDNLKTISYRSLRSMGLVWHYLLPAYTVDLHTRLTVLNEDFPALQKENTHKETVSSLL